MTQEIIDKIIGIITGHYSQGYRYFGIRGDNTNKKPGQYFAKSNDWEQSNPTSHKLDGTCAVHIPADSFYSEDEITEIINTIDYTAKTYSGNLYIIAGEFGEYGEDESEVIISNCRVYKDGKGRNVGGLCIFKF